MGPIPVQNRLVKFHVTNTPLSTPGFAGLHPNAGTSYSELHLVSPLDPAEDPNRPVSGP